MLTSQWAEFTDSHAYLFFLKFFLKQCIKLFAIWKEGLNVSLWQFEKCSNSNLLKYLVILKNPYQHEWKK